MTAVAAVDAAAECGQKQTVANAEGADRGKANAVCGSRYSFWGARGTASPWKNAGRRAGRLRPGVNGRCLVWLGATSTGAGWGHPSTRLGQASRHPRAHAAATWLSFILHGPAAAAGRAPASHSRRQAAAQLRCAQRRRREQPVHCCRCRLASTGASWRCLEACRAPLRKHSPAPVWPSQLQGRRGAMGATLGGQHGPMHRHCNHCNHQHQSKKHKL